MAENRLVTELFFERPSFEEVSKVAHSLEEAGLKVMLLPPEDRGINTHLVVENADLGKVHEVLERMGINTKEKEVVLIELKNSPGTLAETTKRISDKGINLIYAFSVTMSPEKSYVLFGSEDNKAALKALSED